MTTASFENGVTVTARNLLTCVTGSGFSGHGSAGKGSGHVVHSKPSLPGLLRADVVLARIYLIMDGRVKTSGEKKEYDLKFGHLLYYLLCTYGHPSQFQTLTNIVQHKRPSIWSRK